VKANVVKASVAKVKTRLKALAVKASVAKVKTRLKALAVKASVAKVSAAKANKLPLKVNA
jgi:hypothetical protein